MTVSLLNTLTVAGAYSDALNTAYGRDTAERARSAKASRPAKTRRTSAILRFLADLGTGITNPMKAYSS